MLRQVQQFAAELVIDNLRKADLVANVSKEAPHDRDHRPVLFGHGLYDLPEDVAIEKKRKGHVRGATVGPSPDPPGTLARTPSPHPTWGGPAWREAFPPSFHAKPSPRATESLSSSDLRPRSWLSHVWASYVPLSRAVTSVENTTSGVHGEVSPTARSTSPSPGSSPPAHTDAAPGCARCPAQGS